MAARRSRARRAEAGLGRAPARAGHGGLGLTAGRMGGMDAGPGGELGDARLVRRQLAADDGGDDAAGDRADGGRVRPPRGAGAAARRPSRPATWRLARRRASSATRPSRACARSSSGSWPGTEAGRYVAAAAIAGAGLYQLTRPEGRVPAPLPRPAHVPRRALAARPDRRARDGRGARRGLHRLLLGADGRAAALGAMSLTWMALVAALIAAERLLPWGDAPAALSRSCSSRSPSVSRWRPARCPA